MESLNHATSHIQISGIRKFADLVSQYPDALSLTIGQPHFPTPEHIKQAGIRAITEGQTTYTPNRGLAALRFAAHTYYGQLAALDYHPDTEILVTVGATHALDISLRALLNPGDEVLIPAPAYPGYEPIVWLAGSTPIYIDTREDNFKLTPNVLATHITASTKAIILASPANPTGTAYTREEYEALASVICQTNAYVITDEIYSELRFDGEPYSFANVSGMRDRTVVIEGLSKSHSMTGWRIGFALAPESLVQEMVKVVQYSVSCASSISQYAALEALTNGQSDAKPMREQYLRNRDIVVRALHDMGLSITPPEGAFYAFPDISQFGLSSQQFASRLLDEARVAVVPGDAFSPFGEGYIRLSYACEEEKLIEGLRRLQGFLERL